MYSSLHNPLSYPGLENTWPCEFRPARSTNSSYLLFVHACGAVSIFIFRLNSHRTTPSAFMLLSRPPLSCRRDFTPRNYSIFQLDLRGLKPSELVSNFSQFKLIKVVLENYDQYRLEIYFYIRALKVSSSFKAHQIQVQVGHSNESRLIYA